MGMISKQTNLAMCTGCHQSLGSYAQHKAAVQLEEEMSAKLQVSLISDFSNYFSETSGELKGVRTI